MGACSIVLTWLVLTPAGGIERKVVYADALEARVQERELERAKIQGTVIRNVKWSRYETPFDCRKGPVDGQ